MAFNNASIDYENEITKLDPHLFSPRRLSSRIQPLFNGRTLVVRAIAHQCLYFTLVVHRLRGFTGRATQVGIIGGGRVGVEIAQALLDAKWSPRDLAISTRQPEDPRWMARVDTQVARYHDNVKLAQESDVVILAMPPSQLTSVGIQIKHALSQADVVLVSVLAGVGLERVSKVCGSTCTLQTRVAPPHATGPAPPPSDTDAAAIQYAQNNSSGLQTICLYVESFALRLGLPANTARDQVVDVILGQATPTEEDFVPFHATKGSIAAEPTDAPWRREWTAVLRTTQRIFSQEIHQMDVPTS
ncbi:Aste57867_24394 [Aphanomyces stellatus]|uniref:Aste57867_24394 protein n=1 Tax=Aphanomyces stellatus TaxID=120398 RepID=A0A485LQ80_9STRA|nr:hypothetical protein As57867_024318 [Aphanomyces stellatus]VFU01034.1 Aste57867_24394 [Aphanomyces stellatus]